MANINEILARAAALRDETALNSISPERAGGIMYDTLLALNELWLQQGAALVISKIYASVAAMEADTAPVSDLTGKPLRPGQIVVIASSDSDNGSVYRYNGTESPSWSLVGSIGNLDPVDSLDSDSTTLPLAAHQGKVLDGKISQLGQVLSITTTQLSVQIGIAEKYVSWTTGQASDLSSYSISDPIELFIGDKVKARCAANSSIAVLSKCNTELTSFTPLVQGPDPQTFIDITYQATEHCYVCFSWLTGAGITAEIMRSNPLYDLSRENNNIIGRGDAGVSVSPQIDGHYVAWSSGNIGTLSSYAISAPIPLLPGDTIKCTCAGNSAIALLSKCDYNLSEFVPLIQGPDPQTIVNIQYEATESCFVCISYLKAIQPDVQLSTALSFEIIHNVISGIDNSLGYSIGNSKVPLSPGIGDDSHYVNWTSGKTSYLSSYAITAPIHLLKGDTIVARCAANSSIAVLSKCNYGLSLFTPLIQGPDPQTYIDINYVATETCYVCISYLKGAGLSAEIHTNANVLKLRESLLNIITDPLQLNPLYGKSVLFEGDSICAGIGTAHGIYPEGWAGLIGVDNQMDFINQSISGSTIESIADRIQYYYEHGRTQFDYVILEGGTNDADTMGIANLGTLSPLDSFDSVYGTGTFYERMERLLQLVIRLYPSAKIGYIVAQKMGKNNVYNNRRLFFDAAINCCKKWGVSYVDLWEGNTMNPNITEYYPGTPYSSAEEAAADGSYYIDGQHLSYIGYEYLQNNIQAWMKTL